MQKIPDPVTVVTCLPTCQPQGFRPNEVAHDQFFRNNNIIAINFILWH